MRVDRSVVAHLDQRSFGAAAGVFPPDGMRDSLGICEDSLRELLELHRVAGVLCNRSVDRCALFVPDGEGKGDSVEQNDKDGEGGDPGPQIQTSSPALQRAYDRDRPSSWSNSCSVRRSVACV
jgi:hypothetical protein